MSDFPPDVAAYQIEQYRIDKRQWTAIGGLYSNQTDCQHSAIYLQLASKWYRQHVGRERYATDAIAFRCIGEEY